MKYEVVFFTKPPMTVEVESEAEALMQVYEAYKDWMRPPQNPNRTNVPSYHKDWDAQCPESEGWTQYEADGSYWAVRPAEKLETWEVACSVDSGTPEHPEVIQCRHEEFPALFLDYIRRMLVQHYSWREEAVNKVTEVHPEEESIYGADWKTWSCVSGLYWACREIQPLEIPLARTQKARGIAALGKRTLEHQIFRIEDVKPAHLIGKFARPCPMTPRHGFVDSRLISTPEEAEKIIAETRAADPQAEIIAMPLYDAVCSGIWTPGLLTVGGGTDGATQGAKALQIPTLGDVYPWKSSCASSFALSERDHVRLLTDAAITQAPYVEILWKNEGFPKPVQLRDGPKLPQEVNYIPKEVTVSHIIRAEGDLLEWETRMKSVNPGTVVYHPGGSLASHYAIHCILNEVPVLIDRKPVKGETLKAESKVREVQIDGLRAGFFYAQYWEIDMPSAVRMMMAATHNISLWKGRCDFLLGLGMGCAYRLTVIAGLGEFRHAKRSQKGSKKSRDTVYNCYWKRPLQGITETRIRMALESFADPEQWSGDLSFGGRKWYEFLKWAPLIHNQLLEGKANEALESLNKVTNAVHNGGWGFNKFVNNEEFDETSQNPLWALLQVAVPIYKTRGYKQKNLLTRMMKRKPMEIPAIAEVEKPKKTIKTEPKNQVNPALLTGDVDLYIVQKQEKSGEWINTSWTKKGSEEAFPVPLKKAEKACKEATAMWSWFKYRVHKVYSAPAEEDLYIVEAAKEDDPEIWWETAWVTGDGVPHAEAQAAMHQAIAHQAKYGGDYLFRLKKVYEAKKPRPAIEMWPKYGEVAHVESEGIYPVLRRMP